MDNSFLQIVSIWAPRAVLFFAVLLTISTYMMTTAFNKLEQYYKAEAAAIMKNISNISNEIKVVNKNVNLISPAIQEILVAVVETEEQDDLELRKLALDEYKNKEYFNGLEYAEKAITIDASNPKNYLVRALHYFKLYENFSPSTIDRIAKGSDVKVKFTDRWFESAMSDYKNVLLLSKEQKNERLFVHASLRIAHLNGEYALSLDNYGKTQKILNYLISYLQKIMNQYPDYEETQSYVNIINSYIKISKDTEELMKGKNIEIKTD